MNSKKTTDAQLIANYRLGAALRRSTSSLRKASSETSAGVVRKGGIITITVSPNAKPLSTLGGTTSVLGRSKFAIPELKGLGTAARRTPAAAKKKISKF